MKRLGIIALIASGWSWPAQANSGIGMLMHSAPALVLMLLPAILLEAPILARFLGLGFKGGLRIATFANILSTFVGIAIALAIDAVLLGSQGSSGLPPGKRPLLASLVPMFFITWWVESRVVRRDQDRRPGTAKATFAANCVSYAALVMLVFTPVFAFIDVAEARNQVDEAAWRLRYAASAVEAHWKLHARFPATLEEAGHVPRETPFSSAARIDRDGRLFLRLRSEAVREIHAKQMVLEPRMKDGALAGWSCRLPEVPREFRPYSCRHP